MFTILLQINEAIESAKKAQDLGLTGFAILIAIIAMLITFGVFKHYEKRISKERKEYKEALKAIDEKQAKEKEEHANEIAYYRETLNKAVSTLSNEKDEMIKQYNENSKSMQLAMLGYENTIKELNNTMDSVKQLLSQALNKN